MAVFSEPLPRPVRVHIGSEPWAEDQMQFISRVEPDHREAKMSHNMTMPEWSAVLWQRIFADDPAEIARLEALLEGTQAEAVDEFIEQSCWSEDVPQLVGGKGTPAERREALRAAYRTQNGMGDR